MNKILLTLAIPTFNRSELLDKTLESIVQSPRFDDSIEVIISDNNSTDNTSEIVNKYTSSYANIKYSCNSYNLLDANFLKVLSMGNGEYLKLLSDNVSLKSGTLGSFLDIINEHLHTKEPIFFYNNVRRKVIEPIICKSMDSFVGEASFLVTWLSNFGAWKDDFINLPEKQEYSRLRLSQVDWTLKIIKAHGKANIFYCDYYNVASSSKKLGHYNIFRVFVVTYLGLVRKYLKAGDIKWLTYITEKNRLYKEFVCLWFNNIFISPNRSAYKFDKRDTFKILFKYYWYYPHLYVLYASLFFHRSIDALKRILYTLTARNKKA